MEKDLILTKRSEHLNGDIILEFYDIKNKKIIFKVFKMINNYKEKRN